MFGKGKDEKNIVEETAVLNLSGLDPKDREEICKKLGGLYDEQSQTCLVKIQIDKMRPIEVKILKLREE